MNSNKAGLLFSPLKAIGKAFIAFILSAPLLLADDITVVADDWLPYNGDPDLEKPGYGVEILHEVFTAAGHNIVYKLVPWNKALKGTRDGKYDAVLGAFKEDAPDFVFPSEAFGVSRTAFFAKSDSSIVYTDLDSIKTYKVGLIKNYSYGEKIDNFFKGQGNLVQFSKGSAPLERNIKHLMAGKIDLIMDDSNVVMQKVGSMDLDGRIKNIGYASEGDNVYVAFSPNNLKSEKYAKILSDGIVKMKKSGKLEKLLGKYGLKKYW